MADGSCSDGKTVANIINEKLIKSDENLFNYDKSICSDSVECANRKISASDIQKSGLKRDYNNIMTGAAVGTAANHNQQHQYENDINVQQKQQQQQQHKYLSVTDAQASAGGGTSSNCKIELSNILSNAAAAATPSNNQLQKIQGASENCNNNNLKNNKIKMLSGNINNNSKNLCNSSTTSSGATNNSAVLKNKNNNINKNSGLLISQKSMDSATSDMDTSKSEDNSSSSSNGGGSGGGAPEADDHRAKKKRCSDRYDSSESSDSGVATLSCTDSSTASSDASDPGSPYSPVSIGDDVHQSPKANMPPQTVLATQAQQQQQPQPIPQQHQWPWNTLNNTTTTTINNNNNNNNNNFSANNKNSVSNSVASSNKHKRISTNSSDNNGTAKKVRTTLNSTDKTQSAPPSAVKRLKTTTAAAIIEESQKKITGYFKSQMKPLNTLKKDISNLVALSTDIQPAATGLDKYFNILTKVKDDQNSKESKANSIKNNIEVDVRTLTTMPPSLKKIERKQTKVAQVAPISRKTAAGQQPKSPKKPVAIAPRTAELKKNTAAANQQQQHQLRKTPSNLQPTVLLTAIRIPQPGGNQQQVQTSQSHNTGSGNKVQASTKVGSVFQIPVMPNLVQIPNLLATNGTTNLVVNNGQLARVGNGAQYFLNGTVIKLQQFGNNGNGNSNNGGVLTMESGLSGNILVKPTTIAQAVPLTTTTSTKTTLPITQSQTPIVSHHQQQQQQPTLTTNVCSATAQQISGQNYGGANHHQRLAAQPVFMATTTGLLLNAALPAVLATTSKPPGLTQAIPALHPIQPATQSSNILPSLSTILQTHHHHHHHQTASTSQSIHHHHHHNQPAQFLVSQANAILSSIPETTLSNITPKLSHGLTAVTSIATSLISPVPPLVTLACAQASVSTKLAASIAQVKSSSSLLSIDTSESGIADSSSDESQMTDQKELKLKESLSLMIKPQFPDTNAIFDMLKNEPPTIPLQQIKIEELKPCLPSPKSLVLEQIKQKTPPDVFTDEGIKTETSSSSNSTDNDLSPSSSSDLKSTSIDIDIEEESSLPKSAISPILSQPKTIRFPALPGGESGCRFGPKGTKRHDGVCYWDNCNAKHDTSSKLLDHLQTHHANTQTGPFTCLWSGCKVHGRQSCSRRWLERHVLSHGGTKPFKCIVDGCGLRFGSQLALQKHVNGHFNTVESKDNPSKRASDPPVPKVLRKSGKKLRYRRQPFSARLFDFFDSGVMEGLQHRLMVTGSLANGPKGSVTFQGRPMARRTSLKGVSEVFMQWNPSEIIADEWIPETEAALTKTVAIHTLKNQEIIALQNYIGAANLNSDISTMFNQISTTTTIKATTATLTSSITSSSNINNNLQPTTRKQSRKPPKRIQPS